MDAETRQSLGGALVGVVLLAIGLAAQFSEVDTVKALGGVALWGGGVLLVVLALRTAALLMRREV